MRADGTFIAVEVDDGVAGDHELAVKLKDACPVDIFAVGNSGVELVEQNLDECVLCRLCLDAMGGRDPIPVHVLKLYEGETPL
jgi:hypothetical protein